MLDAVKDLGFTYATRAGVTVSKNDIVTPPRKGEILAGFELQVEKIHDLWQQGLITEGERKEKVVEIWGRATEDVADEMMKQMRKTNPIFMMATSGARGSFKQIRQLAGMRGLMANPKGEIIERPVKANFMEGLSVLEYFVSTHGARKGLADTALRTADSGYLTRRLVDVSQDMIVREEDCGTEHWIETEILRANRPNRSLVGRVLAERLELPDGTALDVGEYITGENFRQLVAQWTDSEDAPPLVRVRSVLGCQSDVGVCRRCYGYSLATGAPSEIGDAVGIIAAQSIGEPGTQLTMRTFHEGGVAGSDITHGLPRVVELFEARNPKGAAILSEIAGRVERVDGERSTTIVVWPDATADDPEPEKREYPIPRRTRLMVTEGEIVGAGDPLTEGSLNPTELLELSDSDPGRTEVYIVGEVLKVYESPGRRDQRQAHRADRASDAQEGARRGRGRHPLPSRPARRQAASRPREPAGHGGGRPGGRDRPGHPGHHEGIAGNRELPVGRLLPGDDQGAHRRRDRGQDRPPHRAQGERDHRQADPGLHRAQALPPAADRGGRGQRALPRSACSPTWRRRSRSTATASRSCSARTESSRSSSPSGSRSSPPTSAKSTRRQDLQRPPSGGLCWFSGSGLRGVLPGRSVFLRETRTTSSGNRVQYPLSYH